MQGNTPAKPPAHGPVLRRPEDYAGERGGYAPWCGPTAVAHAAGLGYAAACGLLTRISPERYPPGQEIITAWWSDLLAAIRIAGAPVQVEPVTDRPTLCRFGRTLPAGWWLVRVTGHFLLLHVAPEGVRVFDNRLHGERLSAATHGRRRVTHAALLPNGPRPPA